MKQTAIVLLVIGLSSVALGTSKAYDITPYGNCIAQTGPAPNNIVTQYVRNTLDSITMASVWEKRGTLPHFCFESSRVQQ